MRSRIPPALKKLRSYKHQRALALLNKKDKGPGFPGPFTLDGCGREKRTLLLAGLPQSPARASAGLPRNAEIPQAGVSGVHMADGTVSTPSRRPDSNGHAPSSC